MMKLAIVVLCAASANAFSLTMSSYLEQLGRQSPASSGSSYSYGSSAAPSPASYTTPSSSYSYGSSAAPAPAPAQSSYSYGGPPAPAPYVSAFANMPANKDLNYLVTLGGGSKKKWGADYSGVSSTFRPTQSIGNSAYLDNLKNMILNSFTAAPPAAPAYSYASSWSNPAPAPAAPAQASYSYGGGSGSGSSYSYGGSAAPAPAPYVSSFAPSPNSGSSAPKSTSSYLSSL